MFGPHLGAPSRERNFAWTLEVDISKQMKEWREEHQSPWYTEGHPTPNSDSLVTYSDPSLSPLLEGSLTYESLEVRESK